MPKTMDLYIRVSSVGGRSGESYRSPSEQYDLMRDWAKREGIEVGKVEKDENVKGGTAVKDRKLEGLIVRIEKGISDGLLVEDVKRFGRSIVENSLAADRIRKAGGRLVGVADGTDSAQPGSKMLFDYMSLQAEHQREQIGERWARVNVGAVNGGIHVTARAPIGYARKDVADPERDEKGNIRKNGRLIVEPAAAAAVRRGFEMRAEGQSAEAVAEHIRQTLKRGFSKQSAYAMLKNPAYLGEARGPNGVKNAKAHEPIVTPELFAAAQRKGHYYVHDGSLASQARLSGLVFCAACGKRMAVSGRASYMCFGKSASGPCDAPSSALVKRVDDHVAKLLSDHIDQQWEATVRKVKRKHGNAVDQAVLRAAFEKLVGGSTESDWLAAKSALDRARDNLGGWMADMDAIVDESGLPAYREGLARLTARVNECEAAMWNLPDPGLDGDTPIVWLDGRPYPYEVWGEDADADRRMFRRSVAKVIVSKADPARRGHQPIAERVTVEWK